MNKVIKYRKFIILFVALLSILFGVFIFSKVSDANLDFIIKNANNLKYMNYKEIIFHIILINISFLLSFVFVGIIAILIYLFFEGIVIGFMTAYFISLYHLNGVFYSLIYILIFKFLIIFLFTILIFKYLKVIKNVVKYLKKEPVNITKTIVNIIIISFTIILNDFILTLFGTHIINIFSFLTK